MTHGGTLMIARNHTNHRVGEAHQRAKLSDAQVVAMRAEYRPGVFGYNKLAERYNCGISTVRDIVQYRTRYSA